MLNKELLLKTLNNFTAGWDVEVANRAGWGWGAIKKAQITTIGTAPDLKMFVTRDSWTQIEPVTPGAIDINATFMRADNQSAYEITDWDINEFTVYFIEEEWLGDDTDTWEVFTSADRQKTVRIWYILPS